MKNSAIGRDADYLLGQNTAESYAVATGLVNAYAVTLTPVPVLIDGQIIEFKANLANTATCTLNVNGGVALPIYKQQNQPLIAGDIKANQVVVVSYQTTYYEMLSTPSKTGMTGIEKLQVITVTTTLDDTYTDVICDNVAGFTVNLPPVSSNVDRIYTIKNINTGTITVDADGSETIDGDLTQDLFYNDSMKIGSDGTAWYILN